MIDHITWDPNKLWYDTIEVRLDISTSQKGPPSSHLESERSCPIVPLGAGGRGGGDIYDQAAAAHFQALFFWLDGSSLIFQHTLVSLPDER